MIPISEYCVVFFQVFTNSKHNGQSQLVWQVTETEVKLKLQFGETFLSLDWEDTRRDQWWKCFLWDIHSITIRESLSSGRQIWNECFRFKYGHVFFRPRVFFWNFQCNFLYNDNCRQYYWTFLQINEKILGDIFAIHLQVNFNTYSFGTVRG